MNNIETSEENQALYSVSPQSHPRRVRIKRERVSQNEIDDLNERHERILRAAADVARQVIELGERLREVKTKIRHGKWVPFVEQNLKFSMRTVQRYMKAAEQKYDPILSYDPAEFMARIWGNKPELEEGEKIKKGKNDVDVAFDHDEESDSEEKEGFVYRGLDPLTRPDHVDPDEWNGILFYRESLRMLDAYLEQPVAETIKLRTMVALYEIVAARLDRQAAKCNLTLEQALEIKRTKNSLTETNE
jgi:hypothetical protein